MRLIIPKTQSQLKVYYALRWLVLRKPWGQPRGSEKDQYESSSYHVLMINEQNEAIGVGRIHSNTKTQYQVRYMAVAENHRNKGIGTKILATLEAYANKNQAKIIKLNARSQAMGFYQVHGYKCISEGETIFGSIHHVVMQKSLS